MKKLSKKQIEKKSITLAHIILGDYARDYLSSYEYDERTKQKMYEQMTSGLYIQIRRS
jgi:hypothetical protein|tara:strand:+ start:516 stop:689 length:174 start_codon:yes stop_codon:yes gene_type:complete